MMIDSAAMKSTKLRSRNGRKSKILPIFFGGSRELTVSAAMPTRAIVKKAAVGGGIKSVPRFDLEGVVSNPAAEAASATHLPAQSIQTQRSGTCGSA